MGCERFRVQGWVKDLREEKENGEKEKVGRKKVYLSCRSRWRWHQRCLPPHPPRRAPRHSPRPSAPCVCESEKSEPVCVCEGEKSE